MRRLQRRGPSRRAFLAASAAAVLSAACGEVAPSSVTVSARPYWEPALTVATDSLEVVRTLELSIRELAAGSLTPEQFAAAAQARFEAIGALGQALVPLSPPPSATAAHGHLTTAVDALVEIIPTLRAYEELEEPERLVHVITLQQRARRAIGAFAEAVGPGRTKNWLLATIVDLGEFQFDVVRVPMLAVLVGPFDSEIQARARIGQRLPTLRLSRVFRRWVEAGRVCTACGTIVGAQGGNPPDACPDCNGVLVQRRDDRESVVRERLAVYRESTAPLADYYRDRPTFRSVDGSLTEDEVAAAVADAAHGRSVERRTA